jgi:hypothetical protein
MTFPVLSATAPTGYNLTRSLRFRKSASAYLNRTNVASPTNNSKWTLSFWIKRGSDIGSGTYRELFGAYNGNVSIYTYCYFDLNDKFYLSYNSSSAAVFSNNVFRDPTAWYHIVVQWDTTPNQIRAYVNGVEMSYAAQAPAGTYISSYNYASTSQTLMAQYNGAGDWTDGYLTEVNFIDGQALGPTYFGQTSRDTGSWIPKKYTGTYGNNGSYLPFTDTTSDTTLCYDKSGRGNNWTPHGISTTAGYTYDSMTDVPTLTSATVANYCTWNPLNKHSSITLQDGNLYPYTGTTAQGALGTFGVSSGKWYWEVKPNATTGGWPKFGIAPSTTDATLTDGVFNTGYAYAANGTKRSPGSDVAYGASFAAGDIIGVALDMDAGTLTFYKNNVSQGTAFTGLSGTFSPAFMIYGGSTVNFGQQTFTYTPPSGHKTLCTYNLPTPTIPQGAKYFDATLYTGNGGTNNIVNAQSFQPALVWTKSYSNSGQSNLLTDIVRGNGNSLYSQSTSAQTTRGCTINSNGFTYVYPNEGGDGNYNGYGYVGWQWKGGGAAVTNTTGSTSCQLSASAASGFSVATFTPPASGTSFTIGHGLGVTPQVIITKISNNGAVNWFVYTSVIGNTGYMALNAQNGNLGPFTGAWNNTSPTSSVATFGSYWIGSSYNMVAYFFAPIAGYSAFGSYLGNGSSDGPFVYLGFRARYILFKSTNVSAHWIVYDTSRSPYNVTNNELSPDSTSAQNGTISSGDNFDILANGFKFRGAVSNDFNTNGYTYMYMAFAENPFQYANAR